MRDASIRRLRGDTQADHDHHEYHSAVEVDETQNNWRDWIGPALAIAGVILAVALLFLTGQGYI